MYYWQVSGIVKTNQICSSFFGQSLNASSSCILKVQHQILKMRLCIIYLKFYTGIVVRTKDGLRQCRARLCVCTADLPAKALVCNMKAYNGEYACPTCLDKGDNTVGPSFLHRYWPFNPSMVLRTEEGVWEASSEATTTGSSVSFVLPIK